MNCELWPAGICVIPEGESIEGAFEVYLYRDLTLGKRKNFTPRDWRALALPPIPPLQRSMMRGLIGKLTQTIDTREHRDDI